VLGIRCSTNNRDDRQSLDKLTLQPRDNGFCMSSMCYNLGEVSRDIDYEAPSCLHCWSYFQKAPSDVIMSYVDLSIP
jgi:hypothetical protein